MLSVALCNIQIQGYRNATSSHISAEYCGDICCGHTSCSNQLIGRTCRQRVDQHIKVTVPGPALHSWGNSTCPGGHLPAAPPARNSPNSSDSGAAFSYQCRCCPASVCNDTNNHDIAAVHLMRKANFGPVNFTATFSMLLPLVTGAVAAVSRDAVLLIHILGVSDIYDFMTYTLP